MLRMKKGCRVPDPGILNEGYEVGGFRLLANVHADRIIPLISDFLDSYPGLYYFVLELPTPAYDEPKDENGDIIALHTDVYYLDRLARSFVDNIIEEDGELLVNDGMSAFGFGLYGINNEIFCERYNRVVMFSDAPEEYIPIAEKFGLERHRRLLTARDTFSSSDPGECRRVVTDGRTVYDLIKKYEQYGFRLAERRLRE